MLMPIDKITQLDVLGRLMGLAMQEVKLPHVIR